MSKSIIYKLIGVIVILSLHGCVNNNEKKENSIYNKGYLKGLSISRNNFGEFTDHFPETIGNKYLMQSNYPKNNKYKSYYGSILIVKNKIAQVNILQENNLDRKGVGYFNECTFILNDIEKDLSANCENEYFIVPNIEEILNKENDFQIDLNDLQLYKLASEQGMFIDSTYLSNDLVLPTDWSHGYSKGIAVGQKSELTIFWVLFW